MKRLYASHPGRVPAGSARLGDGCHPARAAMEVAAAQYRAGFAREQEVGILRADVGVEVLAQRRDDRLRYADRADAGTGFQRPEGQFVGRFDVLAPDADGARYLTWEVLT